MAGNGVILDRRRFLGAAAGGAVVGLGAPAAAQGILAPDFSAAEAALAAIRDLAGPTSYVVSAGGVAPWRAEHEPDAPLFVGSAIKTFILARFLKDVAEGLQGLDEEVAIDDAVRSLSSPVFINLTGTTTARSALEAMITHSDNTATDIAMARVGVERVRSFIADAGLASAKIPTSTRHLFSYLAGADAGVDVGWEGAQRLMADELFGPIRSPLGGAETMVCSAADFVDYYRRALSGEFFPGPAMLTEFRRISSMANALSAVVPPHIAAYGKGGSIEWNNFNALCLPGEMWVGAAIPVTFCFTLNWEGDPSTIPTMTGAFGSAVAGVLAGVADALGGPAPG